MSGTRPLGAFPACPLAPRLALPNRSFVPLSGQRPTRRKSDRFCCAIRVVGLRHALSFQLRVVTQGQLVLANPNRLCEKTRCRRQSALSSPTTLIAQKIRTAGEGVGLGPLRSRGREVSKRGAAQGGRRGAWRSADHPTCIFWPFVKL